jgi:WD40 repeat protein
METLGKHKALRTETPRPRRINWPALVGYDFFISFKLGAYPLGAQSYASDLARRLRERDFTVFFSEEEAPPGEVLDSTLRRNLRRSRVLVVIANQGALLNSKWVRAEVEEFRRTHPGRPVIPIDVDGAIDKYGTDAGVAIWLGHEGRIWLNESEQALKDGIASESVVSRLALTPRFIRANSRLRLLGWGMALVLSTLTGWALVSRQQAVMQQQAALSRQLAAQVLTMPSHRLDRTLLVAAAGIDIKPSLIPSMVYSVIADKAPLIALVKAAGLDGKPTFEMRGSLLKILTDNPQIKRHLHLSEEEAPICVAFNREGTQLVSGGWDGAIRVWDVATGRQLETPPMRHDGQVASLAFSPDGKILASGGNKSNDQSQEAVVRLWDTATWKPRLDPIKTDDIRVIEFTTTGEFLAAATVGESRRTLRLWDVVTGEEVTPFTWSKLFLDTSGIGIIHNIAFNPMVPKMLAVGDTLGVHVWGNVIPRERLSWRDLSEMGMHVYGVAFSPDGKLLAADGDMQLAVWDVANNKPLGKPLEMGQPAKSIAFSPNGETLAVGHFDGTLGFWDMPSMSAGMRLKGHKDAIMSVAFSPDGKTVASGGPDGIIRFWFSQPERALAEVLTGPEEDVASIAVSANGKVLVAGHADGTIRFWDLVSKAPASEHLPSHKESVETIVFSHDGNKVATAAGDSIKLWDAKNQRPIGEPMSHKEVNSLVFVEPNGKTLISVGRESIRFWDSDSQKPLGESLRSPDGYINAIAISPDGKLVASGDSAGVVRLWNVATRKPDGEPLSHKRGPIRTIAFTPDGKTLVVGGQESPNGAEKDDGSIRFWDLASRQQVREPLLGFVGNVWQLAFSSDGTLMAGGSDAVRLWDVPMFRELGVLPGSSNYIAGMAFNQDGTLLVTGGDGRILLWDLDPKSWQQRACRIANRNLDCKEWREYFGDEPYRKTCDELPGHEECD